MKSKKITAMLLALIMMFTALSVSAFAAGSYKIKTQIGVFLDKDKTEEYLEGYSQGSTKTGGSTNIGEEWYMKLEIDGYSSYSQGTHLNENNKYKYFGGWFDKHFDYTQGSTYRLHLEFNLPSKNGAPAMIEKVIIDSNEVPVDSIAFDKATGIYSYDRVIENISEDKYVGLYVQAATADVATYEYNIGAITDRGASVTTEPTYDTYTTATISEDVEAGSDISKTLYFWIKDTHYINTVTIDGETTGEGVLTQGDGYYSYTFNDKNISKNTEHKIEITTLPKEAVVRTHFVNEAGEKIAEDVEKSTLCYYSYSTEAIEIDGYELKETPKNASGIVESTVVDVTYVYTPKPATIIVKYVDEDGREIAPQSTLPTKFFDVVKIWAETIDGYRLVDIQNNVEIKVSQETTEITFVYKEWTPRVIVRYTDKDTEKEISDALIIEGKLGEKYSVSPKPIENYVIVGTECLSDIAINNEYIVSGVFAEDDIEILYIYEKTHDSDKDTEDVAGDDVFDDALEDEEFFEEDDSEYVDDVVNTGAKALPLAFSGIIISSIAVVFLMSKRKKYINLRDENEENQLF